MRCAIYTSDPDDADSNGYSNMLSRTNREATGLNETLLTFFSTRFCALIALIWVLVTLAVCLSLMYSQGRVPKGTWPYISDTFVNIPGNWISRWACVGGGTVGLFGQVCLYILDNAASEKVSRNARGTSSSWFANADSKMMCVVACVAILGMEVVGCVNEDEDPTIHFIAAGLFFGGYDLYMIVRTFKLTRMFSRLRNAGEALPQHITGGSIAVYVALTLVSVVATLVKYTSAGNHLSPLVSSASIDWGTIAAILEWIDCLCIIFYFFVSVWWHGDAGNHTGLALLGLPPSEEGRKDMGMPLLNQM
jgi:hypothetical protein